MAYRPSLTSGVAMCENGKLKRLFAQHPVDELQPHKLDVASNPLLAQRLLMDEEELEVL